MRSFAYSVAALVLLHVGFPAMAGEQGAPVPLRPAAPTQRPLLSLADGRIYADFEGRIRIEVRENGRDFNSALDDDNDDSWAVSRLRFGLGVKPADWVQLYAQLQDTREFDSARPNTPGIRGTEGDDNFDLRQAYVELGNSERLPLSLVAGRQRLSYGDQRLVADARWNNFGRTFDAVKLRWQQPKRFALELFAGRPVQIKEEVFNDSDSADNFFGAHLSTEQLGPQTTELYVFHRDKEDAQPDLSPLNDNDPRGQYNGPAQRVTTLGTRWKSKPDALGGWDYTLEAAFQTGEVWEVDRSTPSLDHRAFAAHVSGGYTWQHVPWSPRLGGAYNFASGDEDPSDRDNESFQNLFPSNHDRFGLADFFGWRNLHNAQIRLSARLVKAVELELAYHASWLAENTDYAYRSNGFNTHRTRTPDGRDVRTIDADPFLGHELQFVAKWNVNQSITADAGYSHFFTGDYFRDTGSADDADFGYVQLTVTF